MLNFKRWYVEFVAPTAMPQAPAPGAVQPNNPANNANAMAMKKQLGQDVADEIMKSGDPQNALKMVLARKLKAGQIDPMKLGTMGQQQQTPGTQQPMNQPQIRV